MPVSSAVVDGGLLLVDKPAGVTSHDVVARVRRLLHTRRVGHAGTLDPLATGLLLVAVERSTKLLGHLTLATKSYAATIRLGQSTVSDDADGELIAASPPEKVSNGDIQRGLDALTGDLWQVPSAVSAIKVDGVRAYQRIRDGQAVELAARPVRVSRLALVAAPRRGGGVIDLDVEVDCTTGTYVRALARDLGAALGVGGHLTRLRRTAVGPFSLVGAIDVYAGDDPPALLPAAAAIRAAFPVATVDQSAAVELGYGRSLPALGLPGVYGVLGPAGQVLGLLRDEDGRARPVLIWRAAG